MVSTTRENGVFLLQPGSYVEEPDPPGEEPPVILLVEDDVPTLRLERVILEEAGYAVRVVGSGEEALQSLAQATPALVMLDIGLPGMDGFTTCERIRESSEVPVLMVSGLVSADDKARGKSVGATDYVTKPFATQELAKLVSKLLLLIRTSLNADSTPNPSDQVGELPSLATVSEDPSHDSTTPEPPVAAEPDPSPVLPEEPGNVEEAPGHPTLSEEAGHTSAWPGQSLEAEPESEPVSSEGPAEPDHLEEPDDGVYEGTVRLMVTTPGAVSSLLAFVGELRQNPGFRLLRLVANQSREGMDIWLGLREPLSLRTILQGIEGVSRVTTPAVPDSNDGEPSIRVFLGAG